MDYELKEKDHTHTHMYVHISHTQVVLITHTHKDVQTPPYVRHARKSTNYTLAHKLTDTQRHRKVMLPIY